MSGTMHPVLETSARLLRLLSLLQTHRDWAGADPAQRLDVTGRTLRRDVDRLRSLGYPVHARLGAGGGYRLGVGATLPPLLLDDEEAVAVAVGLRSAAMSGLGGMEDVAVRALAKLEQVLPSRLRHRVADVHAAVVGMPGRGSTRPTGRGGGFRVRRGLGRRPDRWRCSGRSARATVRRTGPLSRGGRVARRRGGRRGSR